MTRYPTLVSGVVLVCPALPDADGRLFTPTLGTQLRLAATRALLSRDDTGREYVRRVIGRRRQEVLDGRLQLYGDGSAPGADAIDGYLRPMRVRMLLQRRGHGDDGLRYAAVAMHVE